MEFLNCRHDNAEASKPANDMSYGLIAYCGLTALILVFAGIALWRAYRRRRTLQIIYILIRRAKSCGSLGDAPPQPAMDDVLSVPTEEWVAQQIRALGFLQLTLTFLSPLLGCLPGGDIFGHVLQSVMIFIAYSNIPYLLEDMKSIHEDVQQHVEGHLSGSMGGCIAKTVACCFCKSKRLVKFMLKLLSLPTFINALTTGLVMKASFDMMFELHSSALDAVNSTKQMLLSWALKMSIATMMLNTGTLHIQRRLRQKSFPSAAQALCIGAGLDMPRKIFTSLSKLPAIPAEVINGPDGIIFAYAEEAAEEEDYRAELGLVISEIMRVMSLLSDLAILSSKMSMVYWSALSGVGETKRKKVVLAILVGLASFAGNASSIKDIIRKTLFQTRKTAAQRLFLGYMGGMLLFGICLSGYQFAFYFNHWLFCTDDLSKVAQTFREVPVEIFTTLGVPIGVIATLSYCG